MRCRMKPTCRHSFMRTAYLIALAVIATIGCARAQDGPTPPGTVFSDCGTCPELVVIPAGSADVGSDAEQAALLAADVSATEQPQHRVEIRSFALGRTTVTRAQFSAFAVDSGYKPVGACGAFDLAGGKFDHPGGLSWLEPGFVQSDRDPVVCVNIQDIEAYLAWLGRKTKRHYRLPSEAEWEYAARAGTTTMRYWGDAEPCIYANGADRAAVAAGLADTVDAAAMCDDHFANTAPAGSFVPNAYGLYDMLGNVSQWIADCFHPTYDGAPADGSAWAGEPGCRRVLRGGAWFSSPAVIRVSRRGSDPVDAHGNGLGFRIARDIE